MMRFDPCAIVLVVMGCVVIATTGAQAASLAKLDCTKCRLDVYSFGSKDYDCGISRHNRLPICVVDCKILYNMLIPIPNLVLDFDLNSCVERGPIVLMPSPSRSSTTASSTLAPAATTPPTTTTRNLSTVVVATTVATLTTVIPEASATSSI